MTSLSDFLIAAAGRPFVWGEDDCCTLACDWVLRRRGVDPAATWRGRYSTARGAALHLRRGGGLLAVATAAMAEAKLFAADLPQLEDIGVVETDQGPALAIRTGLGWACRAPAGITVAPFATLAAWSV